MWKIISITLFIGVTGALIIRGPPVKSGECPATSFYAKCAASTGALAGCQYDYSCPGTQKCCPYGCIKKCLEPAPLEKSGTCPQSDFLYMCANPSDEVPLPVDQCQSDAGCPGEQKCCTTPCTSARSCVDPAPLEKSGTCPQSDFLYPCANPSDEVPMPVDQCQSDAGCPGEQKCCTTPCTSARSCVDPAPVSNCLASIKSVGTVYCIMADPQCCKSDSDCSPGNNCCATVCGGTSCTGPVTETKPCLHYENPVA